jgi:hypothetical protein
LKLIFKQNYNINILTRKTIAVPIVDNINWNTLKHNGYLNAGVSSVGIWEWGFLYKEMSLSADLISTKPYITSPNKYFIFDEKTIHYKIK